MKALSIRQPWAWLIVNGYKDVENRTWPTHVRGTVLIHAAKTMTEADYDEALAFIRSKHSISNLADIVPKRHELELGGIVGRANIINCSQKYPSPWFTGKYGFVIRDACKLPFHPLKGSLSFFEAGTVPGVVDRDESTGDMFGEAP
jgi:hypothetical protein